MNGLTFCVQHRYDIPPDPVPGTPGYQPIGQACVSSPPDDPSWRADFSVYGVRDCELLVRYDGGYQRGIQHAAGWRHWPLMWVSASAFSTVEIYGRFRKKTITLSMPRTAPGEAQIRARGQGTDLIAGHAERLSATRWMATLWPIAGQRTQDGEQVPGASLKELRELLETRIASQGQWWR